MWKIILKKEMHNVEKTEELTAFLQSFTSWKDKLMQYLQVNFWTHLQLT